jgi:peptide/nickel transport system ATP-binding protein
MVEIPVLEVDGLRTRMAVREGFVHTVDGMGLRVHRGELVGLVGESGCGKTMTALSIMRLLPPGGRIVGGRVLLSGTDLADLSEPAMRGVRGARIGMVFQDPMTSLNPTVPIGRQVAEPLRLHRKLAAREVTERVVEMLDLVGLPAARGRLADFPHQLSGGMRQRVMIARALVCEPELLIADEPTTALDTTIQHQILGLIDELRARLGMAVILVTHDLGVIANRADRVAVMYAGKVVETAGARTLFGNPRHPYTEALFEALPEHAAGSGDRLYSIPGAPPDPMHPPTGCRFAPRCRYATARCGTLEPELAGRIEGHAFACFHPVGDPDLAVPTGMHRIRSREATDGVADRPAAQGPLLRVTNLVRDFPLTSGALLRRRVGSVSAVAGVSFSVPAGQTFGLVGESGCGKTTVGRCVVGLERPDDGTIRIDGVDVTVRRARRHRRDAHLIFQDSYAALDPRMRVGAIVAEPLAIHGVGTRAERIERVGELLVEVGLRPDAAHRYAHEFSGGQRQRIGLARALALRPKLIVADEPVSALDVSIQAQILNLLKDVQRRHGLTYVLISHDLSVVRYLADRIGVMYLGKLVEHGPAESVYTSPAHPYTHRLLATIPVADPWAARSADGISGELPSATQPPSGCRFRTRCPSATQRCSAEEPLPQPVSPGHDVACHYPMWTSNGR